MKQQTGGGADHSGPIWVLGIFLVLAVAAASPYWQVVGLSVLGGDVGQAAAKVPAAKATGSLGGVWLTVGALVLVLILAGMAQLSEGAGGFALMLLLVLWGLFLLSHAGAVRGAFSLLSGNTKAVR